MKRPKFTLHSTPCRRCGKPITTGSRPLFRFMVAVQDIKGICEGCITTEERARLEAVTRGQDGRAFS